jgi:SEC-C motif-containing protein
MEFCACGSQKNVATCCGTYIKGESYPITAEQLMRSRYTAYATCEIPYILATTHSNTRGLYNATSIREWASSSKWQRLEIISALKGLEQDEMGYVEFKAYYLDATNKSMVHHEYSTFKKEMGIWYFIEGKVYNDSLLK